MRAGSERVPRKNTRTFANIAGGLCQIKLEQLLKCKRIEKVFVSTDDTKVIEIATNFNSEKINIVERPGELAASATTTDALIKYVLEIMPDGHILWTHVTSPFIGPDIYDKIINSYFTNLEYYDSLMTVTKLQKFIWNEHEPLNYNRAFEKWPRTQTLSPLWEVNSGAFMASKNIYKNNLDRIGQTPYLFQLSNEVAFDIDWLPDFEIAETLFNKLYPR